ncbi:hypothetical protein BDY21DRAFT_180101 [Lineolata rhizophorae]|uniref:Uncharacterized protein n=1 Tax=Lineolata rhizophorae TaxID=578093 RepID=A0A6A6P7D1_9PEZI|nr:hypothetical protein BDY21DRAFT_180101 [Lineolata rhizophorae]
MRGLRGKQKGLSCSPIEPGRTLLVGRRLSEQSAAGRAARTPVRACPSLQSSAGGLHVYSGRFQGRLGGAAGCQGGRRTARRPNRTKSGSSDLGMLSGIIIRRAYCSCSSRLLVCKAETRLVAFTRCLPPLSYLTNSQPLLRRQSDRNVRFIMVKCSQPILAA